MTTLFEHAGGADALLAFARAHHERCLADPVVRHPFVSPGVDPRHDERLAAYLGQVWGGPPAYTDAGGSAAWLARRHAGQGGEGEFGHRFLDCLLLALDDAGLPSDAAFRRTVTAYLQWSVADMLAWAPPSAVVPEELTVRRWSWDTPVEIAASNNAYRIEDVARAADIVSHRDADRWWAERRTPPFHPDAVTLRRGLTPAAVLAGTEPGPDRSVKDSFADVDLTADGFTVLLEGSWLWRGAARSASSGRGWTWSVSRTGDMTARDAAGQTVASCNATRSGAVVGITNADAPGVDDVVAWREIAAGVATFAPNAPLVAWEPEAGVAVAVAAGFVVTGPMRVWTAA